MNSTLILARTKLILVAAIVLGALLFAPVLTQSGQAVTQMVGISGEQAQLASLLNADGTLKSSTGFSASVDAHGYRMELLPGGAPRFVPEKLAEDDAHWNPRFNLPGPTYVGALAASGRDIYVGCSVCGDVVGNGIARWDGSTWSALGSGIDNRDGSQAVFAIAVSGNDLYAGGSFDTAGGVSAKNIARWDGKAWSALGSGLTFSSGRIPFVSCYNLTVSGSDLYVGGNFDTAGGVSANNIARWNGSSWSALGGGLNLATFALASSGDSLYAGGFFTIAGGKPSIKFARYVYTPGSAASVSAASYLSESLAPESIAAVFGQGLATSVQVATALPLATSLGGTVVIVRDGAGIDRPAPLFFVSPGQVNYQIPEGTAPGSASVSSVSSDDAISTGNVNITATAPGLFTADASGRGLPAAIALRIKANGAQSYEPVARFDSTQNRFVAVPIDLGPDLGSATDQVYLILYGTGWRLRSTLSAVAVTMGGVSATPVYAGAAPGFVGLDQINVLVPRSLGGRGEVEITLSVDGRSANAVRINIR